MFIDPVRLSQEVEATLRSGQPYYWEFGLVVVPEVTVAAINSAIPHLVAEGYLEWHSSPRNAPQNKALLPTTAP